MKLTKKELRNLYTYFLNGDIRSAFEEVDCDAINATASYYVTDSKMKDETMRKIGKMCKRKLYAKSK